MLELLGFSADESVCLSRINNKQIFTQKAIGLNVEYGKVGGNKYS
jgi:hypothetical protein